MKRLPNTILGLIEELDELYPARCIFPQEPRPEADHYAGKRALVVELKARYEAGIKSDQKGLPDILTKDSSTSL